MELEFTDDKFVLFALTRYALPRSTYAVNIAIENIISNWDKLNYFDQKQIHEEVISALKLYSLTSVDKKNWQAVLDLKIKKE